MWPRLSTRNSPIARCAHQAECIGDKLYVFGGWSETQMLNDLQILDCDTLTWTNAYDNQTDLSFVACRSGHSMNALGNKLVVFGGGAMIDSSNVFLNETLLFDIASKRWSVVNTGGIVPGGRTKHTSNVIDGKLYIVGGGDGLRLFDDVYSLDTETMLWNKPLIKGVPPSPRWGHSTVQVGSQLVVFGGHEGVGRVNDVHILDTVSMTWRREACPGRTEAEIPRPRAGHTANLIGNHMLVWGGGDGHVLPNMYGLDTRTWTWWLAGGTPPRCAHTSTVVGNKLIAFGGGDGVTCFNDSYSLDIEDKLETLYQAKPQIIVPVAATRQEQPPVVGASVANRPVQILTRQNNRKNTPLEKVVQSADGEPQPSQPQQRPPGSPPTRRRSNSKSKNKNNLNNQQPNSTTTTTPMPLHLNGNSNTTNNSDNSKPANGRDTQGISTWLTSLGMSKYLNRFIAEVCIMSHYGVGVATQPTQQPSAVTKEMANNPIVQYCAREIDMDIIDMITESHLKLLGIPLGDRLRICAAICTLSMNGMSCSPRSQCTQSCWRSPFI